MLLSLLACLAPQVGVNLESVLDWHRQTPFVDAFKSSRPWISHQSWTHPGGFVYGGGPPPNLDADGWPQSLQPDQLLDAIVFADQGVNYPHGIYTIRYEGVGTVQPRLGGNGTLTILHQSPGLIRCDIRVPTSGYFTLRISSIQQPIRNIRIYLPGFDESDQVFHPDFVDSVKPFEVLRFMNWQRTNNSPVVSWQDIPDTDYSTQALTAGVAPAYMAALCNLIDADMWVCVPHMADDQCVQNLAALLDSTLDPSLSIYVEYSNEVWNGIFDQNSYASTQGQALASTPWTAAWRFYSQRSVQVFQLFQSSLSSSRHLVRVLAGQSVNPWVGTQIMDWQNAHQHADAYAVAPYFGGSLGNSSTASMDIRELLYACDVSSQSTHQLRTAQNAIEAQQRGLDLLAYEGGQHLVGVSTALNNQTLTDLFIAANRHPAMRSLYYRDLLRWDTNGGGLFMAYRLTGQPSRFGSFGLLEYQSQPRQTAYKWMGIMDFISR
ncbi:MAG: hypothetical protein Unbinned7015contig1001_48 [Prokaryotic dsDNA virus sp.]|nr:MAG: hypothetical protein Unbinned7015contig1001_48 [Prokaryotic dsDNA virus sp.]